MKRFLVPGATLLGLFVLVGVILLLLPGAEHVQREFTRTLIWVGNAVLMLVGILTVFLAPYLLGWPFAAFTNRLLDRYQSSRLWHLVFLLAFGALLAVVWPYLVQSVVPEIRWLSAAFAWVEDSGSDLIVYETPPFGWGIYAAIAQGVIYFFAMSLGKDVDD